MGPIAESTKDEPSADSTIENSVESTREQLSVKSTTDHPSGLNSDPTKVYSEDLIPDSAIGNLEETTEKYTVFTTDPIESTTIKYIDTTENAVESTATSVEATANSVESTANSVESTANSVESTATSVESTAYSVQSTANSVESTASSVEYTAVSVETTATSVESTATSVQSTASHFVAEVYPSSPPHFVETPKASNLNPAVVQTTLPTIIIPGRLRGKFNYNKKILTHICSEIFFSNFLLKFF